MGMIIATVSFIADTHCEPGITVNCAVNRVDDVGTVFANLGDSE